MKFLVCYTPEHYPREKVMSIFDIADSHFLTEFPSWRKLQQLIDPGLHFDNLKFYYLGDQIK